MLNYIKEYWVQIVFICTILIGFLKFAQAMIEATKCSLRNDILTIYDRCKDDGQITHYQLESIQHSAEIYFKLKGNSFVQDIVNRVTRFKLID
jgi:hypothetical protein